jgi:hypothetical protein
MSAVFKKKCLTQIEKLLNGLDPGARQVFVLGNAEQMWPCYPKRFAPDDVHPLALRRVLDRLWGHFEGTEVSKSEASRVAADVAALPVEGDDQLAMPLPAAWILSGSLGAMCTIHGLLSVIAEENTLEWAVEVALESAYDVVYQFVFSDLAKGAQSFQPDEITRIHQQIESRPEIHAWIAHTEKMIASLRLTRPMSAASVRLYRSGVGSIEDLIRPERK